MSSYNNFNGFLQRLAGSNPMKVVFDGDIYELTGMPHTIHQNNLTPYLRVTQLGEHDPDQEDEDKRMGPHSIVFQDMIYCKTYENPSHIEDNVIRVGIKPRRQDGITQDRLPPGAVAAPPPPALQIPATRPQLVRQAVLELGFDLPTNAPRPQFIVPLKSLPKCNCAPELNCNCKQRRHAWEKEHKDYVFYLAELAMLHLNRPLRRGDFKAITEALNRHFQSTNKPCPDRSYSAVDSFVTKKNNPNYNEYRSLVARIFPDLAPAGLATQSSSQNQG